MKIRIAFTESGTGEEGKFDVEIPELTGGWIIRSVSEFVNQEAPEGSGYVLTLVSFVINGPVAAMVATSQDPYFGPMVWTAIVYTQFI